MISTNRGANSRRRQCDFYERVVQILRECNVISMREGANSKRMQRDFYKWGANGVGGVRANYSVRA